MSGTAWAAADTKAPTVPRVTTKALSRSSIRVTWSASFDAGGVRSYSIYRDGGAKPVATVFGSRRSYVDGGEAASTTHTYVVRARDMSGNLSRASKPARGRTLAAPAGSKPADTPAPTTKLPATANPGVIERATQTSTQPQPPAEEPLPPLTLHVALGDSFSSGMGSETTPVAPIPFGAPVDRTIDPTVYEMLPGGGRHPCARTVNNAARLVARAENLTLRDASCAGAVTSNILDAGQHSLPAQIESVTADTALVTLTIGGNDTGLLGVLGCIAAGECTNASPEVVFTHAQNELLQARIANVLAAITTRAPRARVRIAGYPYLLPIPGGPVGVCGGPLSDDERVIMQTEHDRTNAAIRAAAEAAGPNVRYVDANRPGSPFNQIDAGQSRDGCSTSATRWLNGAVDDVADIGLWHPNSFGYSIYAQLYLETL